jgi:hypothetical protein
MRDVLIDAFERIREEVSAVLDDLDHRHLVWRPDPEANTIAWLIWHLTRVQDDHIAAAFDVDQLWLCDSWVDRFRLPFDRDETGYGQNPEAVGHVDVSAELLASYHDAVAGRTKALLREIGDQDLGRIVDERWDPPVTLGVRLVSVISDDLQHVGQAAYVRGLAERGSSRYPSGA